MGKYKIHTIQSNASKKMYPKNHASAFKIHFSAPFNLQGNWVVGLKEIHFPTKFKKRIDPTKLATKHPHTPTAPIVSVTDSSTPMPLRKRDTDKEGEEGEVIYVNAETAYVITELQKRNLVMIDPYAVQTRVALRDKQTITNLIDEFVFEDRVKRMRHHNDPGEKYTIEQLLDYAMRAVKHYGVVDPNPESLRIRMELGMRVDELVEQVVLIWRGWIKDPYASEETPEQQEQRQLNSTETFIEYIASSLENNDVVDVDRYVIRNRLSNRGLRYVDDVLNDLIEEDKVKRQGGRDSSGRLYTPYILMLYVKRKLEKLRIRQYNAELIEQKLESGTKVDALIDEITAVHSARQQNPSLESEYFPSLKRKATTDNGDDDDDDDDDKPAVKRQKISTTGGTTPSQPVPTPVELTPPAPPESSSSTLESSSVQVDEKYQAALALLNTVHKLKHIDLEDLRKRIEDVGEVDRVVSDIVALRRDRNKQRKFNEIINDLKVRNVAEIDRVAVRRRVDASDAESALEIANFFHAQYTRRQVELNRMYREEQKNGKVRFIVGRLEELNVPDVSEDAIRARINSVEEEDGSTDNGESIVQEFYNAWLKAQIAEAETRSRNKDADLKHIIRALSDYGLGHLNIMDLRYRLWEMEEEPDDIINDIIRKYDRAQSGHHPEEGYAYAVEKLTAMGKTDYDTHELIRRIGTGRNIEIIIYNMFHGIPEADDGASVNEITKYNADPVAEKKIQDLLELVVNKFKKVEENKLQNINAALRGRPLLHNIQPDYVEMSRNLNLVVDLFHAQNMKHVKFFNLYKKIENGKKPWEVLSSVYDEYNAKREYDAYIKKIRKCPDRPQYLYVYCDVAAVQHIGDLTGPLLCILRVPDGNQTTAEKFWENPLYKPVAKSFFHELEVNIRDEKGCLVSFDGGVTIATLDYQQIS